MKLKEIISIFNRLAPFAYQESYDNSGLQTGDPNMDINSALICIDITEEVVKEAVKLNSNLIISHHPVIFQGLKSITGRNPVEKVIMHAIRENIAILSVHTNFDNIASGVSSKLAEKIGLQNLKVLDPIKNSLLKLVYFVPESHAEPVREKVFSAGGGVIGNYDMCSFNLRGEGTFRASEQAKPYVGQIGKMHIEKEIRVETILPSALADQVILALLETHPYEEVAYDLYPVSNKNSFAGAGLTGVLPDPMDEMEFLQLLKVRLNSGCIRHTKLLNKKIEKVAVCGGSGSFLLDKAVASGADVFVTGDFKYHQFFDADNKILVADVGHYESEQFTKELFYELLIKNYPKFALYLSEVNTNPINYF